MTPSEQARSALDEAARCMSKVRCEDEGDPPGVVTAWVLVVAERFADEDGKWGSTVRLVPADDLPDWQSLGLLEAAKSLVNESWRAID